jgi:hypothetical protein
VTKLFVASLLSAALLFGGESVIEPAFVAPSRTESHRPSRRMFWASVAVLAAASIADVASSWGRQELNPALRGSNGRFGTRAVGMKCGLVGATMTVEWLLGRNHPEAARPFALMNFAAGAGTAAVALRNKLNSPAPRPALPLNDSGTM